MHIQAYPPSSSSPRCRGRGRFAAARGAGAGYEEGGSRSGGEASGRVWEGTTRWAYEGLLGPIRDFRGCQGVLCGGSSLEFWITGYNYDARIWMVSWLLEVSGGAQGIFEGLHLSSTKAQIIIDIILRYIWGIFCYSSILGSRDHGFGNYWGAYSNSILMFFCMQKTTTSLWRFL